jgi:patatin-like phospholipase/acyl hydrolase
VDLIGTSTAAPTVFEPERLPIAGDGPYGTFVDGGISPFNNWALKIAHDGAAQGARARLAAWR